MSSVKWRQFCLGLNALILLHVTGSITLHEKETSYVMFVLDTDGFALNVCNVIITEYLKSINSH